MVILVKVKMVKMNFGLVILLTIIINIYLFYSADFDIVEKRF